MARSHRPPLAEWYVISLRPLGEHGPLRRAAAAHGARTFAVSSLALAPLPAVAALAQALACPLVLFTSPAAVRYARAQAPLRRRRGQTWLAVGAGTAAALARAGIADVRAPGARQDAEGLLALPELQTVRGRRVGLVTAPGGRGAIAEGLEARGALLQRAEVYRRQPQRLGPARRRALQALPARSAVLVSSEEALRSLWQQLPPSEQATLRGRLAIASSERLAGLLSTLGFAQVAQAASARPADLVAALSAHVAAGRFR